MGGLRESQAIGDYVLAHAYLRDDHVLDAVLRLIFDSTLVKYSVCCTTLPKRLAECPAKVKQRLRTGTVVTTG